MTRIRSFVVAAVVAASMSATAGAQHQHNHQHHEGVDKRGDAIMGFEHAKTAHHFRLHRDGGAIEVTVKDAADTVSRDKIRSHLAEIATAFAEGDFKMPREIHDRVPPGVDVMRDRRAEIRYTFEEIDGGGRVRIATSDPAALAAVHDFLRFQIEDHRTGDPLDVTP